MKSNYLAKLLEGRNAGLEKSANRWPGLPWPCLFLFPLPMEAAIGNDRSECALSSSFTTEAILVMTQSTQIKKRINLVSFFSS